jgi:hypothetical protein
MVEKTSAQRSSSVTATTGALAVLHSQGRSLDIREPRQWREAITRLVCHANITTAPSARFSGTVRNTTLGCLNILEIESEYEYGARTHRHIAKDHNDNLVLVFVRSGILEITQLDTSGCFASRHVFRLRFVPAVYVRSPASDGSPCHQDSRRHARLAHWQDRAFYWSAIYGQYGSRAPDGRLFEVRIQGGRSSSRSGRFLLRHPSYRSCRNHAGMRLGKAAHRAFRG